MQLEPAACTLCGREIWIALDLWIASGEALRCSRCELEQSAVELAFSEARGSPEATVDAQRAREAWERENVLWFHGFAEGRAVWRLWRPEQAPPPPPAELVDPSWGWAELVDALAAGGIAVPGPALPK